MAAEGCSPSSLPQGRVDEDDAPGGLDHDGVGGRGGEPLVALLAFAERLGRTAPLGQVAQGELQPAVREAPRAHLGFERGRPGPAKAKRARQAPLLRQGQQAGHVVDGLVGLEQVGERQLQEGGPGPGRAARPRPGSRPRPFRRRRRAALRRPPARRAGGTAGRAGAACPSRCAARSAGACLRSRSGSDSGGPRRAGDARGSQEEAQEQVLERRVGVEAVVVGAPEEGVGDLGEAAPGRPTPRRRAGASRGGWRGSRARRLARREGPARAGCGPRSRGGEPGGPSPATARARVRRQSPPRAWTGTGQGVAACRASAAWKARALSRAATRNPRSAARRSSEAGANGPQPKRSHVAGSWRSSSSGLPCPSTRGRVPAGGQELVARRHAAHDRGRERRVGEARRARRPGSRRAPGVQPAFGVAARTTLAMRRAPAQVTGRALGGSASP